MTLEMVAVLVMDRKGDMADETVFVVVSAPLFRSAPVMEREGMERVRVVVDVSNG